ncbi:MAG: FKBP-type peptidyl-prolyl cis-trans isomerase [Mycobacterium sp.]|nr:FKBP-type peptidyl-prolyl cis-trans isomerase [Mycobacterium sp.]
MPPPAACSVAAVNHSRVVLAACAASLALSLAACGSDKDSTSVSQSPLQKASTETASPASACPTAAPAGDTAAEWMLDGATGSVAVAGSTDSAAPMVKVTEPFSVTETQVKTLKAGDGPVVAPTATVSVCYMGVDGRDGHVFDSSYERGAPVDFPLDGVVPGFQKAIAGQKVGSTVAVAMTSADGYPNGQPRAGIEPGDTLVFAIKILDAS